MLQLWMAVTATANSEQLAVAALITYDVYRTYINPKVSLFLLFNSLFTIFVGDQHKWILSPQLSGALQTFWKGVSGVQGVAALLLCSSP